MAYTLVDLEAMSRSQLQAICKGCGFRANESTPKIIQNILSLQTDKATYALHSSPPVSGANAASSRRRVTRSSDISRQDTITMRRVTRSAAQESNLTRRISARLHPPALLITTSSTVPRKSKITQTNLGVGRPRTAGGSGARAATRNSTIGARSRKESARNRKQRQASKNVAIEEEPESRSSSIKESEKEKLSESSEQAVMDPVVDATPLSSVDDCPIPQNLPLELASFHKLQNEVATLSSCYMLLKEQVLHVVGLQQELQGLRTILDKLPTLQADVLQLNAEVKACSISQSDLSALRETICHISNVVEGIQSTSHHPLGPMVGIQGSEDSSGISFAGLLAKSCRSSSKTNGHVEQLLGKRQRESPEHPSYIEDSLLYPDFGFASSRCTKMSTDTSEDELVFRSPRKRLRVDSPYRDIPLSSGGTLSPHASTAREIAADGDGENGDIASLPHPYGPHEPHYEKRNLSSSISATNVPGSLLGMPPPGVSTDFLKQPTSTLPFSLVPGPSMTQTYKPQQSHRRSDDASSYRTPRARMSPYKRFTEVSYAPSRTPSNDMVSFGLLGNEDLRVKVQTPLNQIGFSASIDPARLLSSNIFDGEETPAASRTLYGTELEGDTRFGEFGIDGLTKGFWKTPGFEL